MTSHGDAEELYERYRKGRAKVDEVREFIRKVRDEKGMLWLIAAMVDGSVGYYTPRAAELQVERFLSGEDKSYAERTMCIYNCDLALEILSDVRYFLAIEEIDEDKVRKVVEFVREWCENDTKNQAKSKTTSMTYPTMVI